MSTRRWTLRRRLTILFALATTFVTVGAGVSWWFLDQSTERELDALVHEELHEMVAHFATSGGTPADFERIALELDQHHRDCPMAWSAWSADGSAWATAGDPELLGRASEPPPELVTLDMGHGWRRRSEPLAAGLQVDLILDGSARLLLLREFQALVLTLLACTAVVGIAAGAFLSRRLSNQLRAVAAGIRGVQGPGTGPRVEIENPPEEIRDVVRALEEMMDNIRRQVEHARLLSAGMAHELRSPIQNMMGEAEVALLRPRPQSEYRTVLESQIEELRDLSRVVDNLVVLCSPREEGGVEAEEFDLGAEVGLRLAREHSEAERRNVYIEVEREGDLSLTGDREEILLAIRNVVGNAIQWAPAGTAVGLRLAGGAEHVRITIDDSGPGVSAADRDRIFEPFYRGPAHDGGRVGYGLGLALSRTAIESHGGRIDVSESPTGGARFQIEIPRSRSPRAASA